MILRQTMFCGLLMLVCRPILAQEKPENFNEFVFKFLTDSTFQVHRIRFPLLTARLNLETLSLDTLVESRISWRFLGNPHPNENSRMQIYDNFERVLRQTGERVVSFEGIENGIDSSLYFKLIKGKWYLVRFVDRST